MSQYEWWHLEVQLRHFSGCPDYFIGCILVGTTHPSMHRLWQSELFESLDPTCLRTSRWTFWWLKKPVTRTIRWMYTVHVSMYIHLASPYPDTSLIITSLAAIKPPFECCTHSESLGLYHHGPILVLVSAFAPYWKGAAPALLKTPSTLLTLPDQYGNKALRSS